MTTDYGGPPPTIDADAAGYWAGRDSTDTETPGPCRLVPGERPDRVLIAASVAASGWPVLALWPGTKRPTHRGSETDNHADHWLTSPAAVARSADEHDDREPPEDARRGCPSYAVLTGQPSRRLDGLALVALDLDGDPDGLAALLAEAGPEAEEWAAETLRVQRTADRAHLWGTVPADECPPTGHLTPGLEWRGSTGYAALPGTRHASGALYEVTGGRYEFTGGGQPDGALYVGLTESDGADPTGLAAWVHPLPVPGSLLAAVRRRLAAARGHNDARAVTTAEVRARLTGESGVPVPPLKRELDSPAAAGSVARRLDGLARAVTDAPPGGGNARLNWSAGKAAALCAADPGAPAADTVRAALVAAYLARPIPPGESARSREAEARRTVASGWRWGSTHPAEALTERPRHDDENGGGAVTLHAVGGDDDGAPGEVVGPGVVVLDDPPTYVDLAALLADGQVPPEPVPDLLHRADGPALLYRGSINRLFGDYHSGKTWVVLAAAAEVLAHGGRVALVDADLMGWRRFVRRLVLLGVALDVLADPERFRMWMPEGSAGMAATVREVAAWSPDLVGLDSLGGVLARLRKSRNNPDDVADAMLTLGPLTADPAVCVVLLDHLAQSAESRKFGPSGSLEKGREVRGVSLRVEVIRPFVPGRGGAARLSVEKDTDGGVLARSEAVGGKREPVAGVFRLAPVGDDHAAPGSLLWAVDAPTPGDLTPGAVQVVDGAALERLSRALESAAEPLSQSKAAAAAGVHKGRVGDLLDVLAAAGYVRRTTTTRNGGQAVVTESLTPYRAGDPLGDANGSEETE